MNRLTQEAIDRGINGAIEADEHANAYYYQMVRQFSSGKSPIPDGTVRESNAGLYAGGLKELDTAWLKLQDTGKRLRKSYMQLL